MAAEPLSPELVLVSPDLREEALESLPPVDPDALFVVARPPARAQPRRMAPVPVEDRATPPLERSAPPPLERRAPLPMALAAYTVEALLLGAARGAALVAAIAILAFVLAR